MDSTWFAIYIKINPNLEFTLDTNYDPHLNQSKKYSLRSWTFQTFIFKINIKSINFIVILCGFFNYIFFYNAFYIRQAKHSGKRGGIVRYSYQIKYIKAGTFDKKKIMGKLLRDLMSMVCHHPSFTACTFNEYSCKWIINPIKSITFLP